MKLNRSMSSGVVLIQTPALSHTAVQPGASLWKVRHASRLAPCYWGSVGRSARHDGVGERVYPPLPLLLCRQHIETDFGCPFVKTAEQLI